MKSQGIRVHLLMRQLFEPQERARPISVYAVGPMAGPVLGSMLGYWILFAGWRWVFGVMTLMTVANWVLLVTSTRETYAPYVPLPFPK